MPYGLVERVSSVHNALNKQLLMYRISGEYMDEEEKAVNVSGNMSEVVWACKRPSEHVCGQLIGMKPPTVDGN